eukprot:TRINITY_DN58446_c0_g1_i1.p1 TRINITY_DN58446_c0_g1~~TRINITY_DN58446_c0_g1_i1.p1  ORF type:complete len:211 (-),score=51.60 TRINITY_DN58446_c0_g1_i1:104-736(-)
MANRTDPLARSIHGTNPQNLIEKIVRNRIYNAQYWKEFCFGLTAETLVDRAVELDYIGGTYGGMRKPTKFLCLVLKLLQIQPEKEIIVEFIKNDDYKYVRILGAFYMRLVGRAVDVYQYLEPLLNDYRKIRYRKEDGKFMVKHVDEVVWEWLHDEFSCDVTLPRLPKRIHLEDQKLLPARISVLEDDLEEDDDDEDVAHPAASSSSTSKR